MVVWPFFYFPADDFAAEAARRIRIAVDTGDGLGGEDEAEEEVEEGWKWKIEFWKKAGKMF